MSWQNKLLLFLIIGMAMSTPVCFVRLAMGQIYTGNMNNTNSNVPKLHSALINLQEVLDQGIAHSMGATMSFSANGNITHVCLKEGGPLFNLVLSKTPGMSANKEAQILTGKHLLCPTS